MINYLNGKTSPIKKYGIDDTPTEIQNCIIKNIVKANKLYSPTISLMLTALKLLALVSVSFALIATDDDQPDGNNVNP